MDQVKNASREWDSLANPSLIGAEISRLEDLRFLTGHGRYIADVQIAGVREVAFVRSSVAHGNLLDVSTPREWPAGISWKAADLQGIALPMVAKLLRDGFRTAPFNAFAYERVRYVGEIVAAVIADTRVQADGLAEQVNVEIEPIDAVVDPLTALEAAAPRLHANWPENNYLTIERSTPDFDAAVRAADEHFTRTYRMARSAPMPIETRGCLAWFDRRNDQLVLWTSTQRPHLIRSFLAAHLVGFDERRVRVITPDVGGAFGSKTNLYPEELALAAMATRLDHPLRWVETRMEHMIATCHAREQIITVRAHAMRDGTLTALEVDIVADGGAYSMITSTSAIEGNMAASVLPGPYKLKNYRFRARSACTNKTPMGPYRGVGRPAAVFAMERTIDEMARELHLAPNAVRLKNLVQPTEFPWRTATGLIYDTGNYPALVEAAQRAMEESKPPAPSLTERIGVGYAIYVEQTAHGAAEFVARGAPVIYGFESARVNLNLSGTLTVEVAVLSQGQGLETTLAQIAAAVTGVSIGRVSVRQGDTEVSPYGMGTVASRSIVSAGGAVYHACLKLSDKLRVLAGSVLGCEATQVTLRAGSAVGPSGAVDFAALADIAWQNVQKLPKGMEPGLEFLHLYRPEVETGTFSAGVHAARAAVDMETGVVRILDYVVVEDCGQQINPMIVEGQVRGGVVQGIGQALTEAFRFDETGQPLAGSLLDYALPNASDTPAIRIEHQHTYSSFGVFGMKGTGEGGAIAPPAAIANAVCDALAGLNIGVCTVPLTSNAVWKAIGRVNSQDSASALRTYI